MHSGVKVACVKLPGPDSTCSQTALQFSMQNIYSMAVCNCTQIMTSQPSWCNVAVMHNARYIVHSVAPCSQCSSATHQVTMASLSCKMNHRWWSPSTGWVSRLTHQPTKRVASQYCALMRMQSVQPCWHHAHAAKDDTIHVSRATVQMPATRIVMLVAT